VTEDLSKEMDNYALFLPALDPKFATYVVRPNDDAAQHPVHPSDLNFLNPRSKLWTYKWCLASAGSFAYSRASNCITQRNPKTSCLMGDSGGYQVAKGALNGMGTWKSYAHKPDWLAQRWRRSLFKEDLLYWLEANCDYAMTLDMPLWVREPKYRSISPWHYCDVELLADLNVENLRYISDHRGLVGNCQFLNVLQGRNENEEDYWYRRVRDFEFEGWAIGGSVGANLSIVRVLRRLLILRDDGMLGESKQWLHILGISQVRWAVALTAIQRAVQEAVGCPFVVSFDSSTPLLWAGRYQYYPEPPVLTTDIATWKFTSLPFSVGYAAATKNAEKKIPRGSPLSNLLTLGDMNPITSPYAAQTFGPLSTPALANHNCYVFIRAFIEANKTAFCRGLVPQEIADMQGTIGELLVREDWAGSLAAKTERLESVLGKARQGAA
jgi:hypothetical protein